MRSKDEKKIKTLAWVIDLVFTVLFSLAALAILGFYGTIIVIILVKLAYEVRKEIKKWNPPQY